MPKRGKNVQRQNEKEKMGKEEKEGFLESE